MRFTQQFECCVASVSCVLEGEGLWIIAHLKAFPLFIHATARFQQLLQSLVHWFGVAQL